MNKGAKNYESSVSPLRNSEDLNPLILRIGDAPYVLLGEASHGTHEYYVWRTRISKRLIAEKAFDFIAVEGDWPDCYRINRFVKGYADQDKTAVELLRTFDRWPTWMWANWEVVALIEWLKEHNATLPANKRVGFYGLDVYSLWESLEALMNYLSQHDPDAAELAKNAIQCFEPYGEDEHRYAKSQHLMSHSCFQEVVELLQAIRIKAPLYDQDPEAALNMEQNAAVAVNAEQYYRNMMAFDVNTWNLRDTHMMETFNRLLDFHGSGAKAIVWEHNTHIGDARYTDMSKAGDINIGQLVREQKGRNNAVLVGFGSYSGSVIAAVGWSAPIEKMQVPEARVGSVEEILHTESAEDKLLIFDVTKCRDWESKILPHRAIGVVYNPDYEKFGNYVPSQMDSRYDAFIYIDRTHALHPLHVQPDGHKIPETFPFDY